MEIYFSANNREEVIKLPIVPIIDLIECETNDEQFDSVSNGTFLLIGQKGLRSFEIQSFFPNRRYPFMSSGSIVGAERYIQFFEKWRDKNVPARVVIIDKGKEILNMACRYSFSYALKDKAGDVPYRLLVTEFRFPQQKKV